MGDHDDGRDMSSRDFTVRVIFSHVTVVFKQRAYLTGAHSNSNTLTRSSHALSRVLPATRPVSVRFSDK